jgi:biotin-(acetyl-CoA carboxylase) ligase
VAIDVPSGDVRKLAGVLGETDGLGTDGARAVIGIGVNADWPPGTFPRELATTMTSLTELAPGQLIDREVILHVFLEKLEPAVAALRAGRFPADAWRGRQLTNGVPVRLEWPGGVSETVSALDVDVETGALVVGELGGGGEQRDVLVGEIRHLRLGGVV